MECLTRIGSFHKCLTDEESAKACLTEGTDGGGGADTAFADLDGILRQALSETEGIIDVGDERAEVAVVDATEVGTEVSIFKFWLRVHLKQDFKTDGMSFFNQVAT